MVLEIVILYLIWLFWKGGINADGTYFQYENKRFIIVKKVATSSPQVKAMRICFFGHKVSDCSDYINRKQTVNQHSCLKNKSQSRRNRQIGPLVTFGYHYGVDSSLLLQC